MELAEFRTLCDAVVGRVSPLLAAADQANDRYVRSIAENMTAGEWLVALEDMVALLDQQGIAVSAQDHHDLRRLLDFMAASRSAEVRGIANSSRSDLARVRIA